MTRYQNSERANTILGGADIGRFTRERLEYLEKGLADGSIVLVQNKDGEQVHASNTPKALRKWELDGYELVTFEKKTVEVDVPILKKAAGKPKGKEK